MKTMFDCTTQDELLVQFKSNLEYTDTCQSAVEWCALFIHAYTKVRDLENEALRYELEQKLDALTGGDK
jgi:hypothetical protein